MKTYLKIITLLTFAAGFFSLGCPTQEALKPVSPADVQTYKSTGVVRAVDRDAGRITIDHEEIPGYMTAMQMNEAVRDPQMLDGLKANDKVEFEIERAGSKITITKITKTGEVATVNGGELYKTNCAECHGGSGEGAPKGISLLKGHALEHTEKEYVDQVTNGEGKKMPAFKDKLSPEQIAAVVKFVRGELQKDVPKEEMKEHKH